MSESDAMLATFCRITALVGVLILALSFVAAKVGRLSASASSEPAPAAAAAPR